MSWVRTAYSAVRKAGARRREACRKKFSAENYLWASPGRPSTTISVSTSVYSGGLLFFKVCFDIAQFGHGVFAVALDAVQYVLKEPFYERACRSGETGPDVSAQGG